MQLFAALRSLGAPLEGLDHTDLLVDYEHFKLVTSDNSVDVLTSIGGMPFDDIWSNRVDVEVEGVPVHFISKADLIENKRQVGRYLDLADAEERNAALRSRLLTCPTRPPHKPLHR